MTTLNKMIRSGAAAVTLIMAAGGGVAQAQTYSDSYMNQRMMQADLSVVDANYRSQLASCNSRLYGGSYNNFGRALSNGAEARACRADALADRFDRVAQVQRRYHVPYTETLRQAYNARVQAIQYKFESDQTRCNANFVDRLGRRGDWQDRARDSANTQRCQANAQSQYYRSMANAERNYTRQIQYSMRP